MPSGPLPPTEWDIKHAEAMQSLKFDADRSWRLVHAAQRTERAWYPGCGEPEPYLVGQLAVQLELALNRIAELERK